MEAHLQKTVDDLMEQLNQLEKQVVETKRMINGLCALNKVPPMFEILDTDGPALTSIKGDTFYGQPFATAATTYLRMRKAKNLGPATVAEIYEALKLGGYQFDATNEDYAKRGVRHSLGKNTQTFHKVPNGEFGLVEWYPAAKKVKVKNSLTTSGRDEDEDEGDKNDDDDEKNDDDDVPSLFGADPEDATIAKPERKVVELTQSASEKSLASAAAAKPAASAAGVVVAKRGPMIPIVRRTPG